VAGRAAAQPFQLREGIVDLADRRLEGRHQDGARIGHGDTARGAHEQRHAVLLFQRAHAFADRGRGDFQLARGPGEAAFLGHGQEQPDQDHR